MADSGQAFRHDHWLALDDERARHLERLLTIQRCLERRPGWFHLSSDEQAEAERVSGLTELDSKLRRLSCKLTRSLQVLPRTPMGTIEGVTANLRIAERLLPRDENRAVHDLIVRAVRDLGRISASRD